MSFDHCRLSFALAAWCWATSFLACCTTSTAPVSVPETVADTDSGTRAIMGSGPEAAAKQGFCAQPLPQQAAPRSVADVVALLNAAPKPVSLPCLLSSLARPLALYATNSVISAQPAVGRRSPRTFLFFDGLIASIVPDGPGSQLLEFGELRSDTRTLKAEIEFPVTETLSADEPFERIMFDDEKTSCAFCHASEQRDESMPTTRAFISQALRPAPRERVLLTDLSREAEACDVEAEPERCAMLRSVFLGGAPVDHEFPAPFSTIVP
jgi:hypothetical protein